MTIYANILEDLTAIAGILTEHPELGTPDIRGTLAAPEVQFHPSWRNDNHAAYLADGVRAFPGVKFTKNDPIDGGYNAKYYTLRGTIGGIVIELWAERDTVCTRVVTATETVTEELPDPALVAKLPTVKTERVIETVEWQCAPLLAKAEAVGA